MNLLIKTVKCLVGFNGEDSDEEKTEDGEYTQFFPIPTQWEE